MVFETLETADIDMSTAHSVIEPIANQNFGNTFHHHNGPNQHQHIHKNTSQQCQSRSYQIPSTSSITYPKEDCIGFGLNNKVLRELLMQHDGKLETCPLRVPLFINKQASIEQLPQNNHRNGSRPKDLNKNSDTSNRDHPQAKIACHSPKSNTFRS